MQPCYCFDNKFMNEGESLVTMKGNDHDDNDDNTDDILMMMLMMRLMTIFPRLVMWL